MAISCNAGCKSPDFQGPTDGPQLWVTYSPTPTPTKCSTRAIMALVYSLGIVHHQYCSSSILELSIVSNAALGLGNGNQVRT